MKSFAVAAFFCVGSCSAFGPRSVATPNKASTALRMVLEKPQTVKEISKLETLKVNSDYLIHPLKEVRWVFCIRGSWYS
jgi:hypothetical protein